MVVNRITTMGGRAGGGARSGGGGGGFQVSTTYDAKTGRTAVSFVTKDGKPGKMYWNKESPYSTPKQSAASQKAFTQTMQKTGDFQKSMAAASKASDKAAPFRGKSGKTYEGFSTSKKGWSAANHQTYKNLTNPNGQYKYPKAYAAKAINAFNKWYPSGTPKSAGGVPYPHTY